MFFPGYHRSNKCLPLPYSNLYVLGNLLFSEIRFANSYVHIMCLPRWPLLSYMKYDIIPYPVHWYSDCVRLSIMFRKHIFEYQARPSFTHLRQGPINLMKDKPIVTSLSDSFWYRWQNQTLSLLTLSLGWVDTGRSEAVEEGGEARLIRLLLSRPGNTGAVFILLRFRNVRGQYSPES